jgi:hypothetical protein
MEKEEIQQRVLKNGKPLSMDLFKWDEKTNTFSSNENGLVLNFAGTAGCTFTTRYDCTFTTGYGCTFTTWSACTFTTGSDCTFTTGSDCTFTTGSDCTFTTGYGCTFTTGSGCTFTTGSACVIVRRDTFEVVSQKKEIQLCPSNIKGYLEKIEGKWYLSGDKSNGEHIVADGILSKIVSKKGNVYRIVNHGEKEKTYLITNGVDFSHGKTLKEAKDSLMYKIGSRDKSEYKGMKLTTAYTLEEAIKMYRVITGACEAGVRRFLEGRTIKKKKYTVKEILKETTGQYGNSALASFIKATEVK